MEQLINIDVNKIEEHPNNPRKDLGDLAELTESIRQNGIMQNLTVVKNGEDKYMAVIGHRRLAAAKAAGLKEVPCVVAEMSEQQQVNIMLVENIQRNGLTVTEQAQGFQMAIDLGNSVDDLAEETGFSKSTIYHRLNIAKLNQKALKKAEDNKDFQLSISDLYILEKIKKVSDRNRILKEATDSKNLAYLANRHITEEKRRENAKKILRELQDRNLEEIPSNKYWWGYDTVKKFELDKDIEKVSLKKIKGKLFYKQVNSWLYILKEREERKAPGRSKKTEEEKMHARNRKKLNAIQDELTKDIKDFIGEMVQGKIDIVATPNEIWDALILLDVDVCYSKLQVYIYNLIYEKNINYNIEIEDDKKEELNNKISEISMERQMLALITKIPILNNWSNEINKESASKVLKLVKVLSKSGFSLTEEQQQFLDGTLADQWKDSRHVHV